MTQKIKATEISFNTMTGLTMRNIFFQDFENKIFTIGRERTKRQYKNFDNITLIKGHLDTKALDDKRYFQPDIYTKTRCFPASKRCLDLDLQVWNEIKGLDKINGCCGIGIKIEEAISQAKEI